MYWSGTQSIVDYTNVTLGLRIDAHLWTGQATTFTAVCPKCGRIGLVSTRQHDKQILVHRGRATGNRLHGIDYCELLISVTTNAVSGSARAAN